MSKKYKIGRRYKFLDLNTADVGMCEYWKYHNIIDGSFTVEELYTDGGAMASLPRGMSYIAHENYLNNGLVVKIPRKVRKFKKGKTYIYLGNTPTDGLVEYWKELRITSKTFIVHEVYSNGDVIAIDNIGRRYIVATSCASRAEFKLIKAGDKPMNFKAGYRYRITDTKSISNVSYISEYWDEHDITDNTFVVDYVDRNGDAYCKIINGVLKCVVTKSDIDKLNIVTA